MRRLAEQSARAERAESALGSLSELRREVDALVNARVEHALASGLSFGAVARAMGVSRQTARRRFQDLAADAERPVRRRLRPTRQAREAVRLARAEANASDSGALGSGHILLGVLQTESEAARALWSAGITLDKARPFVQPGDAMCIRRVLRDAVELAGGSGRVAPEQLLVAALDDDDEGARRAVAALGATPESIKARLGDARAGGAGAVIGRQKN